MAFTKETAKDAGSKSKRGLSERTKLLNELFNPENAKKIFQKLEKDAMAGDSEARKLYLAYVFGKPKESMDITSDGEKVNNAIQVEVIRSYVKGSD